MRLQSSDTLRALIHQRGYSMAQVARDVGCSKAFVHSLCSGTKTSCSVKLGQRIAAALEVPLELLFVLDEGRGTARKIKQKLTA
jgi:transcriptional regulator with XRE-family HTH domain